MALDSKKWGERTSITSCESSFWKGRGDKEETGVLVRQERSFGRISLHCSSSAPVETAHGPTLSVHNGQPTAPI